MDNETMVINDNSGSTQSGAPEWVAFALVTSSYFVVLLGVVTYCLVLP